MDTSEYGFDPTYSYSLQQFAVLASKRITIPMHCACATFGPCVTPLGQFAIYNASGKKQLFTLAAGHHNYADQKRQEQELINELVAFFAPLNEQF
jgi:cephalosporin-C deacetylase